MKTKRIDKRLVLNKKTIVYLDNRELKVANGGDQTLVTRQTCTCPETGDPCVACAQL